MSQKPLPFTKDGFKYFLCEDDEALCRQYLDRINSIEPNKRNNTIHFKRLVVKSDVKLSDCDKAPQIKLEDDGLTVTGEKGYSMIRATHGINKGTYYFEVKILSMPNDSAARIGWGMSCANLQAPLGYDRYGYSWRSVFGTKFHEARGKSYDSGDEQCNNRGYKAGDTIGCMIELPLSNSHNFIDPNLHLPTSIKERGALLTIKKKEAQYRVAELEDKPPKESFEQKGSKISFFKNGVPIGVAFEDIQAGTYYPSISLYKECKVRANFGPKFAYPPSSMKKEFHSSDKHHGRPLYQSMQDAVFATIIDHLVTDMRFIVDGEHFYDEKHNLIKNIFTEELDNLNKQE